VNEAQEARGAARRDLIAAGAAALLCVALYFALASLNGVGYATKPVTYNSYNLLVDGFLAGRLSLDLPAEPPSGTAVAPGAYSARLHDVSLYRGKYYLYFGVAPAVVLFLPWKLVTGVHLAQYWGAALFASLGYLASVALLLVVRRDFFPAVSRVALVATVIVLGLVNWWPLLLSRVGVWEVPIASAFCFSSVAVLGLYLGAREGGRPAWLAAASLAYALAIASRPNYILGSFLLLLPLVYLWRAEKTAPASRSTWVVRLVAAGLPIACVGVLVALYNALRFGDPLEFGTRYIIFLPGTDPSRHFSLGFVWTNLRMYYLDPAHFSPWFPFFKVPATPLLPEGYASLPENMWGLLANMPVLLFAALGVGSAAFRSGFSRLGLVVSALLLLLAAMAPILMLYCGANDRYEAEAMSGLPLLTVLGIWNLESRLGAGRRGSLLARIGWVSLAAYSGIFALCSAIERDDLFRFVHPRAYRALAHAADLPSFGYDRLHDVSYSRLSMDVTFPTDQLGRTEPLVTTGWGPKSNVLYVRYADAAHIEFGFMGASGVLTSAPLAIRSGTPHTLNVSMGSFYPPREAPFFDFLEPNDADALADSLFVQLDGLTVFRQQAYFFDAAARRPDLGRGPALAGKDWLFTGTMAAR
jgi:hypothetical protein